MTTHTFHCEEGAKATDAAIHRVSQDAGGECGSVSGSQWIATGFPPPRIQHRREGLPWTKAGEAREDKLFRSPSLGSFGLAPPQAKTFLASSLLAILETNTEAQDAATAAGGAVVAPS